MCAWSRTFETFMYEGSTRPRYDEGHGVSVWSHNRPDNLTTVTDVRLFFIGRSVMSSGTHISTLYREFADALTDVLAENAVGLASRGRRSRRPWNPEDL